MDGAGLVWQKCIRTFAPLTFPLGHSEGKMSPVTILLKPINFLAISVLEIGLAFFTRGSLGEIAQGKRPGGYVLHPAEGLRLQRNGTGRTRTHLVHSLYHSCDNKSYHRRTCISRP